jgi:pyruvate kinase
MNNRQHKTKIVCTLGPSTSSTEMLDSLMSVPINVARVNFSHGDPENHRRLIAGVREAAGRSGRMVAVMGDLPGPRIRIGRVAGEPVELAPGDEVILTTSHQADGRERIGVNFAGLPEVVDVGDTLFLADGLIQLEVAAVSGADVRCRVAVGGSLRSHKGLNFPGIDLGISAFTDNDRQWLLFAREQHLDALSLSFVEAEQDIIALREAAAAMDYRPFIVAKIERAGALANIGGILHAADGIMIARGDLGVEVPIEQTAAIQKELIGLANRAGKPVITATQMLESMTDSRRPTRAEVTDVANAILDGTDCVMLSGESAIGRYPLEAVRMLCRIARVTEPRRSFSLPEEIRQQKEGEVNLRDLVAWSVGAILQRLSPAFIMVPTASGATARSIARFRGTAWVLAVSSRRETCQGLQFSYGVHPVCERPLPPDWKQYAGQWSMSLGSGEGIVLLTEGPSEKHPDANHRLEILDLRQQTGDQ